MEARRCPAASIAGLFAGLDIIAARRASMRRWRW
jgi:hypothetical protein